MTRLTGRIRPREQQLASPTAAVDSVTGALRKSRKDEGVTVTCIVGLAHEGNVWIGADSAAASGWKVRVTSVPKVFARGPFIIGYTVSFRMGQLLQFHLDVQPQDGEASNLEYIVKRFIAAVRGCLKEGGYTTIDNNKEEGGGFLVGYRGHVYSVGDEFQVTEASDGFDACGCGGNYALGAIVALDDLEPEARVRRALGIAAYFSGGVCGPFTVLSSRDDQS